MYQVDIDAHEMKEKEEGVLRILRKMTLMQTAWMDAWVSASTRALDMFLMWFLSHSHTCLTPSPFPFFFVHIG